jgi:hypothetical protein
MVRPLGLMIGWAAGRVVSGLRGRVAMKLLLLAYIPMVDFPLPLPVLPQKATPAICSG